MNTYIYLVRHGEVDNPKGIIYGRLPFYGLTERGRSEIEQTAAFLKDKSISLMYSSPLLRARQTAKIIQSKLKLPKVSLSNQILETKTSYQGRPFASLDAIQSEIYLHPLHKTDETVPRLANRMLGFINYLVKKHPGKHILFVTHGDPSMSLQAIIDGKELILDSIREGEYIHHGEVRQIIVDDSHHMTMKSIFRPIRT